jgi:hypothetical protein
MPASTQLPLMAATPVRASQMQAAPLAKLDMPAKLQAAGVNQPLDMPAKLQAVVASQRQDTPAALANRPADRADKADKAATPQRPTPFMAK